MIKIRVRHVLKKCSWPGHSEIIVDAGPAGGLVWRRRRITTRERINRLMALGNCNPPQMYYPIYRAIVEATETEWLKHTPAN